MRADGDLAMCGSVFVDVSAADFGERGLLLAFPASPDLRRPG